MTRTLLAAAAAAAFALPAAAQDTTQDPAPPASQAQQNAAPQTAEPTDTTAQPGPDRTATQQPTAQPAAQPAQVQAGPPPRAAATDLVVGAQVIGSDGQPVGTIAEADATGAVVRSSAGQGRLNLDAFFKDARGILIGYTSAQFNELVGGNGQGGPDEADEAETERAAPDE